MSSDTLPPSKHEGSVPTVGLWVVAISFTTLSIVHSLFPTSGLIFSLFYFLVLPLVFSFWHGARRYGVVGIVIFFLVSEIVGNFMENISIATGLPFGNYHYTFNGIPFLFQVPLTIGLAYFAYGYLAWTIGNILLEKADEHLNEWFSTIALPIVSSFIMVMWDVVMDPINSTIHHMWIWQNGGGYNGVPLTNYLGWLLTVYLFFQLFALYQRTRRAKLVTDVSISYWYQPLLLYFFTALSYIIGFAVAGNGVIADATGHLWRKHDIYETAAIVSLYTMVFPSVLAFVILLKNKKRELGTKRS